MNKEEAIRFAGLMEEYLHIPAFVCEMIQDQLENNNYKEVVEYVIQRRNEIESKKDYISEQQAINMWIDKLKEKEEQLDQSTNNWNELEDILKIKKARMLNEPDYSKYYLEGYETAIQATHSSHSGIMLETAKKSIVVLCDELLDKMKEIKEGNR